MDNSVVIDYMTAIIDQVWRLFSSWEIPFIGLTPAYFFGALMILGIVSFLFRTIIGLAGGVPLGGGHIYRDLVRYHVAYRKKLKQQKTSKHR